MSAPVRDGAAEHRPGGDVDQVREELEEAGGDARTLLYEAIIDLWELARSGNRNLDETLADDDAHRALKAARRIALHVDGALAKLPLEGEPRSERKAAAS